MRASFGESLPRLEDKHFLIGRGCYLDDVQIARCCTGVSLRSPHPHADIKSIDTADVLAVITGADIEAAGLGKIQIVASLNNWDGSPQAQPPRPLLATDRTRFTGEAVALVVAESVAVARDAAEAVFVDYEPLYACTTMTTAAAQDATQIWSEAPGNVCLDWEIGDEPGTAQAFENADHIVELALASNRVPPTPMEPRGCIGQFDRGHAAYTLHVSSQGPHDLQQQMAKEVLKIPADSLRVITPDVGGGLSAVKSSCIRSMAPFSGQPNSQDGL